MTSNPENNESVIETNDIATTSKLSASSLGYFKDKFVRYFTTKVEKKSPIFNRGHYARVSIIRDTIRHFINNMNGKQIVCLGAGYDTNYFHLKSEENLDIKYYLELDMKKVVQNKSKVIQRNQIFLEQLSNTNFNEDTSEIVSDTYGLLECDLRNIELTSEKILSSKLDTKLPTLFISECVLIYISPIESSKLISWIGETFDNPSFVIYEQIRPNDPFGKMMAKNLEDQGCPLLSLHEYPELESQINRFKNLNWQHAEAITMNDVYNKVLDQNENKRISKIEIFDELEEWILINDHYCVVYATKYKSESIKDSIKLLRFEDVMKR